MKRKFESDEKAHAEDNDSARWYITPSFMSTRMTNPIRKLVDNLVVPKNPVKEMIRLSIGDPTVYQNLHVADTVIQAVNESLSSHKNNGYPMAIGTPAARRAVAQRYTSAASPLTEDDVVICSGCSGALQIAIQVLLNPGDNLLIPQPGFSLYQTLCDSQEIATKSYNLLPDRNWEIDLPHLESLIDSRTRAILVNNPSNPCGSVYSRKHLQELVAVAERHRLPIISDEIYGELVFEGTEFTPISDLSTSVPVLAVGGIAKLFVVPGWRVGWILIHDRHRALADVRKGIVNLTQLILGANSLIQGALPKILLETPKEYFEQLVGQLATHADFCFERSLQIPGLRPIRAQGTMYIMMELLPDEFKDIHNDIDFSQKLLEEEAVFVLPGTAFRAPNFFRVVFCAPINILQEAFNRIADFCQRHHI